MQNFQDISFDNGQVSEVPVDAPFKQLSVTSDVVDELTNILFETNNGIILF